MRARDLIAALAVGIVAQFAAFAGETTSPETGSKPIPPELAGLRDRWVAGMKEFHVPGMAVAVVRGGEVIYLDTFGYRDLEKQLPVTPETAFYIASCTKPFTAMALLTLVDAGKVRLDDPVQKHLPRFSLPDAQLAASVTLADLLCHRRGINCEPVVFLDAYTGEITEDRYYQFLTDQAAVSGGPEYSNVHYTLLGRVIEAASGKSWRDYLASHVFAPASLTSATGYADAMYARADVAIPYTLYNDGLRPAPVRKTDATMHAAGGLGISISDLARWLILNVQRGEIDGTRVVSAESAAAMQTLHAESPQGKIRVLEGFGLGWMVGTFRPGGPRYVAHSGGYVGASAHTSFLPQQGIGVAVVTNVGPPGAVFAESAVSIDVLDRFAGGEHDDFVEELRHMVTQRQAQMLESAERERHAASITEDGALSLPFDRYLGEYRDSRFGTVRIARRDDSLDVRIGSLAAPMLRCRADAVTLLVGGRESEGRFELADGRVQALSLNLDGGTVRFLKAD